MYKKHLLTLVFLIFVFTGKSYAQKTDNCNPTGSDFKQEYTIDTVCRTYPQIEVVNPMLYTVLDSLIDDVCRYNKDTGTMPYIGMVGFFPKSTTKARVILANYYDRIDTSNTILDDLSREVSVFQYRGIDFYLFNVTAEEMNKYNTTFHLTGDSLIVCYYKALGKSGNPISYIFNDIVTDFEIYEGTINYIRKNSLEEWNPLPR